MWLLTLLNHHSLSLTHTHTHKINCLSLTHTENQCELETYLGPGHSMLETSPAPWLILLCGVAGHKVLGWCNVETWRGARHLYFPEGCLWRGWPSPGPDAILCRPAANSRFVVSCPFGPGWIARSKGASCPSRWGQSPPGTPAECPYAAWLAAWMPISA